MEMIKVHNVGKRYKIGERENYVALRDVLMNILRAPFTWLSSKKKQSTEKNEFWALKDISFSVKKGEVLGIIGRNGAGKSTLLKVLSQITPPTTGDITLRGRVGSLLEVGTGFHPELTGRENIYLNGAILGMSKKEIEDKFDEIVAFSGVETFLDTPVKRYSSGMYVRLAFSVAAHLDPEILVVDEVLAVGDTEFQKKCLGKMEDVTKQDGRTVLFVSHNMDSIRKLCTRTIVLDKGEIVFDGDTHAALSVYNNISISKSIQFNQGEYGEHRRGSGTLSFTNISILDAENNERSVFEVGESVRFNLAYKTKEEVQGLHVAVCLFSNKARDVLLTDARYQITEGVVTKGASGEVTVEIDLTTIRPGEYSLYFWLGDTSAAIQGTLTHYDVVEGLTDPLIVTSSSNEQSKGLFSLPSRVYVE